MRRIKNEGSDEEDVRLNAVEVEKDAVLSTLPLKVIFGRVLSGRYTKENDRKPAYVYALLTKLNQVGIKEPRSLEIVSQGFIENRLAAKPKTLLSIKTYRQSVCLT